MPQSLLITNIKGLAGVAGKAPEKPLAGEALKNLEVLEDAWLLVEDGRIARFGRMAEVPDRAAEVLDARQGYVLPAWCDSHTHLVFAQSRESEWVDRIKGLSYEEIAQRGGGILNSARKLQQMPEEELYEKALERLGEVRSYGTGAIEIKSGYGLSVDSELKMLRVIRRLKESSPLAIRATFLGAHALPMEYRQNRQEYIRIITGEMLPQIAAEGLADYIDVFCEKVAFSVEEMEQVLEAGARYGLKPKVHVNQFNCMGGIAAAIRHGAISVDHLEVVDDADIAALQNSSTMATLLPTAPFFLNDHIPPARRIIDAGIPLALATDFNPGTSPSGRMPFVVSLACIQMRMLPEEAINAATVNGAFAMEWGSEYGTIAPGMAAHLIVTKPMPSLPFLPYAFGSNLVDRVILRS